MTPSSGDARAICSKHALEHEPADRAALARRGGAGRFRRARRSALAARSSLARGLVSHPAGRRSRPASARRGAHARARNGARVLHRRPRDRARRDGTRVPRVGRPARPHGRAEGAGAAADARAAASRSPAPRSARRRGADASRHLHRLRAGGARRRALHRDGVRRGPHAARRDRRRRRGRRSKRSSRPRASWRRRWRARTPRASRIAISSRKT